MLKSSRKAHVNGHPNAWPKQILFSAMTPSSANIMQSAQLFSGEKENPTKQSDGKSNGPLPTIKFQLFTRQPTMISMCSKDVKRPSSCFTYLWSLPRYPFEKQHTGYHHKCPLQRCKIYYLITFLVLGVLCYLRLYLEKDQNENSTEKNDQLFIHWKLKTES